MLEGKLKFKDYIDNFFDEFGNRVNSYIIEKYYKNTNNEWVLEDTIKTNAGSYFVIGGKPYFECNDSLLPLNSDFNSKSCGACYKVVGKDTTEYVKVIGNKYLCENKHLGLKLHKQDYSDGTCFYTLEDNRGEWRVDYGNHDLSELIGVLERGIEIDKQYVDILPSKAEDIRQTKQLIDDIKKYVC